MQVEEWREDTVATSNVPHCLGLATFTCMWSLEHTVREGYSWLALGPRAELQCRKNYTFVGTLSHGIIPSGLGQFRFAFIKAYLGSVLINWDTYSIDL